MLAPRRRKSAKGAKAAKAASSRGVFVSTYGLTITEDWVAVLILFLTIIMTVIVAITIYIIIIFPHFPCAPSASWSSSQGGS